MDLCNDLLPMQYTELANQIGRVLISIFLASNCARSGGSNLNGSTVSNGTIYRIQKQTKLTKTTILTFFFFIN